MTRARALVLLLVGVVLIGFAVELVHRERHGGQPGRTASSSRASRTTRPSLEEVVFEPRDQGIEVHFRDGSIANVSYPSPESQFALQQQLTDAGVQFDSEGTGGSSSAR